MSKLHACPVSLLVGSKTSGCADGKGAAARFKCIGSLKVGAQGTIMFVDTLNARICNATHDGFVTTFASGGFCPAEYIFVDMDGPLGAVWDSEGAVCVTQPKLFQIFRIGMDGSFCSFAGSTEGHRDGPGCQAQFRQPTSIGAHPDGSIIVSDTIDHRIRKVLPSGIVTTLAGNGCAGFADGFGLNARFYSPAAVVSDTEGNVLVADTSNNCVRKITPDGYVHTLAGSPEPGCVDGHGPNAQFRTPVGIALDGTNNLIITDTGNSCLRMVSHQGYVTTIHVAPLPGEKGFFCPNPCSISVDQHGDLLVTSFRGHAIYRVYANLVPPMQPPNAHRDFLRQLLDNSTSADVKLFANGEQLLAHRCILTARSSYFATLFASDPNSQADTVELDGDTVPAAQAFLRYLYSYDMCDNTLLISMMRLCKLYSVSDGYLQCFKRCQAYITPLNVIQWLLEAHTAGLNDLCHFMILYIAECKSRILEDAPDTWDLLAANHTLSQMVDQGAPLDEMDKAQHKVRDDELPPRPAENLQRTLLLRLFEEMPYSDLTLQIGEDHLAAHRCILGIQSEYFATLFGSNFAEVHSGEVELVDTTVLAAQAMLRYAYVREICDDVPLLPLMKLCHQYLMQECYRSCLEHCNRHINSTNAIPWLIESSAFCLEEVYTILVQYVRAHLEDIKTVAPDAFTLLNHHPDLLHDIDTPS